jgi:hypothetical protein
MVEELKASESPAVEPPAPVITEPVVVVEPIAECPPNDAVEPEPPQESIAPPPDIDLPPLGPELPLSGQESPQPGPQLPPLFDGWELDEELRHIERILAVEKAEAPARPAMNLHARFDTAHPRAPHWGPRRPERPARREEPAAEVVSWLSVLISLVLSLGLMAFAFGGVLLAWSLIAGRQDLWTFGMPIALAGQIVLLMGFILQMDRLWHDNRNTAAKLDHVDERLHDLKTTTHLLGTGQKPLSPDLYGDQMAGSLDSQLMLADLKSQLDLLAMKMGNPNRSA